MVTGGGLETCNYGTFCIVLQKMIVVRDNKDNDCKYRKFIRTLIMKVNVSDKNDANCKFDLVHMTT